MRPRDRSPVRFVPVALLVAGIVVHGVRIVAFDEDPQRGTAFAMFARVDIGSHRRVLATAPGTPSLTLVVPAALHAEADDLRDSPSTGSARELAEALLAQTWTVEGRDATAGGPTTFEQVRIQVVGLDADDRTLSRELLVDVLVGEGAP